MELESGRYVGVLKDFGIGKTKSGLFQAVLSFDIEHEGETVSMNWYGSFKEKAALHTVKALVVCGLVGDDVSVIAEGPSGKGLTLGIKVSLVVEREADESGKIRSRISWINSLGGERFKRVEVMQGLSNLKGLVLEARQKTGIAAPAEDDVSF